MKVLPHLGWLLLCSRVVAKGTNSCSHPGGTAVCGCGTEGLVSGHGGCGMIAGLDDLGGLLQPL